MSSSFRRCAVAVLGVATMAAAQRPAPRYYFGEQFTALRTFLPRGFVPRSFGFYPGFGVRFGFSSNPVVALEAEVDFMPTRGRQFFTRQGIRISELSVGLRPGYRWKRFGLFYKIAPGLIDFGNDFADITPFPPVTIRFGVKDRPAFMLENAAVVEYYLSRRYALRCDVGDTFVYVTEPGYPGEDPFNFLQPELNDYHNLQISDGVVFRIWR